MTARTAFCGTCRFYADGPPTPGECRNLPPVILISVRDGVAAHDAARTAVWPVPDPDADGCRQHKELREQG